jgi:hypothetical protein
LNKINPKEEKLLEKVDQILNGVASPVEQQGVPCVNLVAQIERLLLGERTRKIPLLTPDISVK